jgi:hypothetical protein
MASNIPLDPPIRALMAAESRKRDNPKAAAQAKRQARIAVLERMKAHLRSRGMTADEAEHAIAKDFGITVDALHQCLKPSRKTSGTKNR